MNANSLIRCYFDMMANDLGDSFVRVAATKRHALRLKCDDLNWDAVRCKVFLLKEAVPSSHLCQLSINQAQSKSKAKDM